MAKLSLRIFRLVSPEKFVLLSLISIYLIIGMSLDTKYYEPTRSSSEKELSEELRKNNFEYYIVWQNESIIDIPNYETLQDPGFDYKSL